MKPQLLGVTLLAATMLCVAGCHGKDSPAPTTPSPAPAPTPPAPTAVVTRIAVTGNVSLTAVGETSALTATASLSDGTIKDVTTAVQWSSSDPSSITVSAAGMVTVVRYGSSFILARYSQKTTSITVKATPTGTFIVSGRVREPGSGGVGGARIVESGSGASVTSDAEGEYSLGELTSGHLRIEKDGYEPVVLEGKPGGFDDVAMQRVVRIAAGASIGQTLAPHDMEYAPIAGRACYPCRVIRVTVSQAGALQLRVTWVEPASTLNLWVNGQLFEGASHGPSEASADVPVSAGEILVYVGMVTQAAQVYVPLTLTTAMVK